MGEEAVDDGGPQREFLSLVLQEIAASSNILQGPPNSRFLLHNVQALVARKFFYAGMLVAVSLASGRPGLPCLSEAVYNYLCFGAQCQLTPDLSIIPDFTVQKCLEVSLYICNVLLYVLCM